MLDSILGYDYNLQITFIQGHTHYNHNCHHNCHHNLIVVFSTQIRRDLIEPYPQLSTLKFSKEFRRTAPTYNNVNISPLVISENEKYRKEII